MENLIGKKLLVFGDSIMFGSGNNGYGVGEYLNKDLGLVCKKYAVGGARVGYHKDKNWLVDQVRSAIENKEQPDYIIFNGFTNDCNIAEGATKPDVVLGEISCGYNGFNIFEIDEKDYNFSHCFEEVVFAFLNYFPSAKILFVRPHNMGRRDDKLQKIYGERALEICRKWGIPYVDLYSESGLNTFIPTHRDLFTCDSYGWGRGDCTHPNAIGYELKYMPLIESKLKTL
jgi:lysophospholipase L1-like esterase